MRAGSCIPRSSRSLPPWRLADMKGLKEGRPRACCGAGQFSYRLGIIIANGRRTHGVYRCYGDASTPGSACNHCQTSAAAGVWPLLGRTPPTHAGCRLYRSLHQLLISTIASFWTGSRPYTASSRQPSVSFHLFLSLLRELAACIAWRFSTDTRLSAIYHSCLTAQRWNRFFQVLARSRRQIARKLNEFVLCSGSCHGNEKIDVHAASGMQWDSSLFMLHLNFLRFVCGFVFCFAYLYTACCTSGLYTKSTTDLSRSTLCLYWRVSRTVHFTRCSWTGLWVTTDKTVEVRASTRWFRVGLWSSDWLTTEANILCYYPGLHGLTEPLARVSDRCPSSQQPASRYLTLQPPAWHSVAGPPVCCSAQLPINPVLTSLLDMCSSRMLCNARHTCCIGLACAHLARSWLPVLHVATVMSWLLQLTVRPLTTRLLHEHTIRKAGLQLLRACDWRCH